MRNHEEETRRSRGYDLVLLSHVTHDEDAAITRFLVRKAFAALRPGGRLAIHDFVVSEDGCSPPWAALFALSVMVYTEGGRAYSLNEYRDALESAGFVSVREVVLPEGQGTNPTTLILAERGPG